MGLALAWGVTAGSMIWAVFAALGFSAVLIAHQGAVELLRYAGAAYLAWLAFKSARSALRPHNLRPNDIGSRSRLVAWTKGALIHLTNPKAVIFWSSIFAIGLKPGASPVSVVWVVVTCVAINLVLVTSYALLFSSPPLTHAYLRLRRWFESVFAVFFSGASFYLFTRRPN